jgi:hypothetical protein
MYSSEE